MLGLTLFQSTINLIACPENNLGASLGIRLASKLRNSNVYFVRFRSIITVIVEHSHKPAQ